MSEPRTYTQTLAEATGHPPQTPTPAMPPQPQPTGDDDE